MIICDIIASLSDSVTLCEPLLTSAYSALHIVCYINLLAYVRTSINCYLRSLLLSHHLTLT